MRKKIDGVVKTTEAWGSFIDLVVQYWPHILLYGLGSMTAVGTVLAAFIEPLAKFGWGIYPFVGLGFALLASSAFALTAFGMYQFTRRRLLQQYGDLQHHRPIQAEQAAKVYGPDMTIGQAAQYVFLETAWGQGKAQFDAIDALDVEIRHGALKTWGRKCINWPQDDEVSLVFSPNEVPIRTSEWVSMRLWPGSMLGPHPLLPRPHMTCPEGPDELFTCYGYIRVNREQVERAFPPLFSPQH